MIFLQLLIYIVFSAFVQGTNKYYVTDLASDVQNYSCSMDNKQFHPCGTLEMLAKDHEFMAPSNISNVSIIFLKDNYSVYENLSISFTGLYTTQLKPWVKNSPITIICIGDLSILYSGVVKITIESVILHRCGKRNPVLTFSGTVQIVTLSNSAFLYSLMGFLNTSGDLVELTVLSSIFDGSKNGSGMFISSLSSANFKNSVFSNNAAGSIYFTDIITRASSNFMNCTFTNNTSENKNSGGAISVIDSILDIYIDNCTFLHNSIAGAVFIHTTIHYLLPLLQEGIHQEKPTLTVNTSIFIDNMATDGGALAVKASYFVNIYNSDFLCNHATRKGGVIFISGDILRKLDNNYNITTSIINCTFTENFAGMGGVLSSHDTAVQLIYSTFLDNSGTDGGALATSSFFNITVLHSSFITNKAASNGGAIYIELASIVVIEFCNFINNSGQQGGALSMIRANLFNMTGCNFQYNKADIDAGAVSVEVILSEGSSIFFCSFIGNQAQRDGGAFSLISDKLYVPFTISNSNFMKNAAIQVVLLLLTYSILLLKNAPLSTTKRLWKVGL